MFKRIWKSISSIFDSARDQLADFFVPFIRTVLNNGGQILLQAAMKGVIAAEQENVPGEEKFKIAKNAVIIELKTKGIPVVINAVHSAIEAAVAKMKAAN